MGLPYLGEFEQIVLLAVWRRGDDAYGMRIRQDIEARIERPVTIGAVYATLERLAQKGCLKATLGEPTAARGGRARRYYTITRTGVAALEEARRQLARMWQGLRRQPL
jgi:DNA-binding PadR family transcriptional regulator